MKLLVKPVIASSRLEKLYVALECEEFTCECNGSCRDKRRFFLFGDEEADDILF